MIENVFLMSNVCVCFDKDGKFYNFELLGFKNEILRFVKFVIL